MPTSWTSYHSSHAIQEVTGSIGLKEIIQDHEQWENIVKVAHLLAAEWGMNEIRPINQPITSQSKSTGSESETEIIGYEFMRMEDMEDMEDKDAYVEKLTIRFNEIEFNTWEYIRWAGFNEMLKSILFPLAKLYLKNGDVFHTALSYIDSFNSPDSTADAREIINIDSQYLTKNAIKATSNWSTQSTYFDGDFDNKHLSLTSYRIASTNRNRNKSVEDEQELPIREIRIMTAIANFHDADLSEKFDYTLATSFESLHIGSKNMLRSMLTDEAAIRISLGG